MSIKKILAVKEVYYDGSEHDAFKFLFDPEEEILGVVSKKDFDKIPEQYQPRISMKYVFDSEKEQRLFIAGASRQMTTGIDSVDILIQGPQEVEGYKSLGSYSVEERHMSSETEATA